ncbi:hypothetical protein G6L37_01740 [Agrobacterium rubi]|nr:hypothetical protein [Agrobacterium rubi]NTF24116.1 hypothetical protein [Agrobacterium rubi]
MTENATKKTRVKIEIRGRITNRRVFDAICAAGDADLGAAKGEFARLLLEGIREGRSPVITGWCIDEKPLRLTDLCRNLGIPMVVRTNYEKGKNYGEVYCTNSKHGSLPAVPMTQYGPAVPGYLIDTMLKSNPFHGLAEISRSLKYYEAESYPEFTMPRSLQVELMPDEKIGLLAGLRR